MKQDTFIKDRLKQFDDLKTDNPTIIKLFLIDTIEVHKELIEKRIEGLKVDERKVAIFGEWEAVTFKDKVIVNEILDTAIKEIEEV